MTRAFLLLAELDEQTVERLDRHVRQVGRDARDEVEPLLDREEGAARGVAADADDDVAEERRRALDEIEVARAWAGRSSLRRRPGGRRRGCSSGAGRKAAPDGGAARCGTRGRAPVQGRGCRRGAGGGDGCGWGREHRVGLDPHEAAVVGERDAEEREEVGADDAAEIDVEAGGQLAEDRPPSMAGILARSKPPTRNIGTMPRLMVASSGSGASVCTSTPAFFHARPAAAAGTGASCRPAAGWADRRLAVTVARSIMPAAAQVVERHAARVGRRRRRLAGGRRTGRRGGRTSRGRGGAAARR